MNGKLKRLVWLTIASLVVAGCSSQRSTETVVINEDVQLASSLTDSSLQVSRQQDIKVRQDIIFTGIYRKATDNRFYFNEEGKLYSFNLETGEEKKVAERESIDISDNGNWAMSFEDGDIYMHNLKNGEMQLFGKGSPVGLHFVGDEVARFDYRTYLLSLINVENGETTTWDLRDYPDVVVPLIKKGREDMYFSVLNAEEGFSIHRLSSEGKVIPVVNFTEKDTASIAFDMLQNGSVIFSGRYDGGTGVFYWDEQTNDVQQLVLGGKSSKGIRSYNLSHDESKIMFDMPVKIEGDVKMNVYMGELVDGQIINSMRIMENANLNSTIFYSGHWSEDSNTAYIVAEDDNYIENIAIFNVNN